MGINIVTANFSNGGRDSITRKLYQYDYGQKINIKGLNLPNTFEVHISNDNNAITAETYIGNNNEIEIPDKFLLSGEDIYLWIFLHSTAEDGETRYTIIVPVQKKPKPEETTEPTTVEKNTIDQLIAALESNLNEMQQTKADINQTAAAMKSEIQQTIDAVNDVIIKYPKIVDNYWQIYDIENQTWVDTGIKALAVDGADGVGIESIVYNNDYTITINLTNGTSYTTGSIRGQKGDKGDTGSMPQFQIGTVETLLPHRAGYVTKTGTIDNPLLNFGLVKGETGKSAYEYAVDGGFNGTEQEFATKLATLLNT